MTYRELQQLENELKKRATAALRPDEVAVTYPLSSNRHTHLTTLQGEEEAVKDHAAYLLQNDRVTPCYDHMSLQLIGAESVEGDIYILRFSKSNYAGD